MNNAAHGAHAAPAESTKASGIASRLLGYLHSFSALTWAGLVACASTALAYVLYCRCSLVDHEYPWSKYLICLGFLLVFLFLLVRPAFVRRFKNALSRLKPLIFIVLIGIAFVCIELPYNASLFAMSPHYLAGNLAVITMLLFAVYFLGQRSRASVMVFLALGLLWGMANYFVIMFKNAPIVPSDIFVIKTAADVAGSYTYSICDQVAFAVVVFYAGCALAACLVSKKPKTPASIAKFLKNLLAGLLCAGLFLGCLQYVDIEGTFDMRVSTWNTAGSYRSFGSLLSFLKRVQDFIPEEPDGYSPEAAEAILANFEDETLTTDLDTSDMPVIITIMNESFTDLSIYESIAEYYDGFEYLSSLDDAYFNGSAWSSVIGSATCNSEFEFLTSVSMSNFRYALYPYGNFNFDHTTSIVSYLSSLGYTTYAMHQNPASTYRRDQVYSQLGFDNYLSISDFYAWEGIDVELVRGKVSDKTGYDIILDIIDSTSEPLFFFNITMQNHSPYDKGLTVDGYSFSLPDLGEYTNEIEEFLASVSSSEESLAYLIEQLSQLDRKVVLCFFGDHQPWFSRVLLGDELGIDFGIKGDDNFIETDDTMTIADIQTIYEVPCLIWTNYDAEDNTSTSSLISVSESESKSSLTYGTSLNYLAAHVLRVAGLPLNSYYNLMLYSEQTVTAVNPQGYLDTDGEWHWLDDTDEEGQEAAKETLSQLAIVQYELMFGEGVLYRD